MSGLLPTPAELQSGTRDVKLKSSVTKASDLPEALFGQFWSHRIFSRGFGSFEQFEHCCKLSVVMEIFFASDIFECESLYTGLVRLQASYMLPSPETNGAEKV